MGPSVLADACPDNTVKAANMAQPLFETNDFVITIMPIDLQNSQAATLIGRPVLGNAVQPRTDGSVCMTAFNAHPH